MKLLELFAINETPISDIEFKGNFEIGVDSSFPDMDKKLFKNPNYKSRVFKAFEKTPYNFKIIFVDFEEYHVKTNPALYEGIYSRTIFGIIPSPDVITVAIIYNHQYDSTEHLKHMPMTPWMVAHKIGHALFANKVIQRKILNIFRDCYLDLKHYCTFKSATADATNTLEIYIDIIAQFLIKGEVTFGGNQLKKEKKQINQRLVSEFGKLNNKILVAM